MNTAGEDFRLSKGSPCIDVGLMQGWMIAAVDLDGQRRVYPKDNVDMGAYEKWYPIGSVLILR